jgi:sucrose-6-phosphate hydrolase SacC (GH32 family)
MKKTIELLEKALAEIGSESATSFITNLKLGKTASYINEALAELKKSPRWYTPEQWEKQTGKSWLEGWAVYWRMRDDKESKWYEWFPMPREMAELAIVKTIGEHQIVCATEAGPPHDDWRSEEGALNEAETRRRHGSNDR